MKRLRVLSVILFLLSLAGFTVFQVKQMKAEDKLGPLISMDEKVKEIHVGDGEEKLLEGITAADTKDGDVTASLVVEGLSTFLDDKRRLVTYAAFDADNHVSRATREVSYADYVEPRFKLEEPLKFPVGKTDLMEFMKAVDCLDGDLTDKIKISPETSITVDVAGDYNVKFQVANSAGDVVYLPVTVEIYENGSYTRAPQIGLSKYIVYTTPDKKIDAKKYLEKVTIGSQEYELTDGEETYDREGLDLSRVKDWTMNYDRIKITDTIDYQTPGTYEVQYSMTSEDGVTGNVRLIVVVQEGRGKEAKADAGNKK